MKNSTPKSQNRAILEAMSDAAKNPNSRIRTFAQDLNAERLKRGQNPEVNSEVKTSVLPETETVVPIEKPEIKIPKEISFPKPEATKPVVTPTNIELPNKPTPPETPPIKIPAFHELQKKVDLISNDDTDFVKTKKVVPNKDPKPVRANIGYDATVITDTKSKRFKLIPAVITSFKKWLVSLKPAKKVLPPPKYTVPEASHRKGVIQKATSKTGAAFSADSETLKEQIRLRQQKEIISAEVEVVPAPVTEPETEPETTWSPYTEVGYNLLESPKADVTKNVLVEYKKSNVPPPPLPETIVTATETAEEIQTADESDWKTGEELLDNRWSGVNQTLEVEVDTAAEIEQPKITFETPAAEIKTPETETLNNNLKTDLLRFRTNTLTLTILVLVIGILIVFFAARIIFTQINNSDETRTVEAPSAILADSVVSPILLLSSNVDTVPSLINEAIIKAATGIVELPITSQTGEEITPAYTFSLLGFQAKPTLIQSITTARFASSNQSDPTLIIKFVDINTVRGGLLNWESSLFNDFNQLYQNPLPQNLEFVDESNNGFDVRALKNNDETVLIYGFIDENTLIISPDNFSFETFSNLGH